MIEFIVNILHMLTLVFNVAIYIIPAFIILVFLYVVCPPFERLFDKIMRGEL